TDKGQVRTSKLLTFMWGLIAISFALLAKNSENLIEAVNIIGSLFYGTILGIFLVAFFLKRVGGNAVFVAALIAETVVFICHLLTINHVITLGYLWYNAIGCLLTMILAIILQVFLGNKKSLND
ncbi:MAG: SSS family solute:Na+ symporter, partial [Cyclobacteriaceae bacterium]